MSASVCVNLFSSFFVWEHIFFFSRIFFKIPRNSQTNSIVTQPVIQSTLTLKSIALIFHYIIIKFLLHVEAEKHVGLQSFTWCFPVSLTHLQAEDIKILKNDHKKFCEAGPRLMGTKFLFASDKLDDPENLCMTLKAMGAAEPYFLVFGFSQQSKTVRRVVSG